MSLAVSQKALEDGGYNTLGFSHRPGEAEAVAGAATSVQALVLPLAPCWCNHVHDCPVNWESDLVQNERGERGKEIEVTSAAQLHN